MLEYDTPLNAGTTADHVFGQPDLNSSVTNGGGVNAHSLSLPIGLALDGQGNLYAADTDNNRVLEYDTPLSTDANADRVFGQPSVFTNVINNGGISDHSLYAPTSVALDAQGDLYVADTNNSRVLEYDTALSADATADHVFGQPDFMSNVFNNGGVTATSLNGPFGVAVDAQGNLYVGDDFNSRVLEYDWALVKIRLPLVVR